MKVISKRKLDTFAKLYKFGNLCILGLGYLNPSLDEILPKRLFAIIKRFHVAIWVFCSIILSEALRTWINALRLKLLARKYSDAFNCFITMCMVLCMFASLINTRIHQKELQDIVDYYNRTLKNPRTWAQAVYDKKAKEVSRQFFFFVILQSSISVTFHSYLYFKYGVANPTHVLFAARGNYLFNVLTAIISNILIIMSYWMVAAWVSIVTCEFMVLKTDLVNILSHSDIYINLDETELDDNELATAKDFYKENMSQMDRNLNVWIARHSEAMWAGKNLCSIFKYPVVMVYFFTVMTLISLSTLIDMMQGKMQPSLPIVYTILCVALLGFLCEHGEQLYSSSLSVADGIMETDWFLLPLPIQKKLIVMIQVVNYRPSYIQLSGTPILRRETFQQIIQTAYQVIMLLISERDKRGA